MSRYDQSRDPNGPGLSPGLRDAIRRFHEGRRGPPTPADAPPPSVFPMTPAARLALRLNLQAQRKAKS